MNPDPESVINGVPSSTDEPVHASRPSDASENTLMEEPGRFQAQLLDAVGQAVIATDLEGRVIYWNRAAQELYGWSAGEMMGRRLREFVIWEGFWERADEILSALRAGRSWTGEFVLRRKDGTSLPALVTDTPVRDEQGNLMAVIGVSTDISERVQAVEALKESERRFRLLAENARDLIFRYRFKPTPGFEYVSPSAATMIGYTPEEHYADPELGLKIVHPDDRHLIDEVLRDPESTFTIRWLRKDGAVIWAEQRNKPIYDEAGELVAIEGISRDVTEARMAEEERARQARHAALRADVGVALAEGGTLRSILQRCTECIVGHLDAAFARIWTLNEEDSVLELQASAGIYTHLDGVHGRVPVGQYRIGLIAEERLPHLSNDVVDDPRVSDREWARREGIVGFAGYPLIVEGRLVGVMAMFARHSLREDTLDALESVADTLAQGIQRKQTEEALRSSEEFFRALYENVNHPIFLVDEDLNFVDVNPYTCEFYGYSLEEFRGMKIRDITLPEQRESQLLDTEIMRRQGGVFVRDRRLRKKNGEIVTVTVDAAKITRSGKVLYVGKITDITERKRAEEQLEHQAFHDLLTGLPNRYLLVDRLKQTLKRTRRRAGRKAAVLFVDLDNFKTVNDSLGHEVGDRLLVAFSERLKSCLRPEDTLARFGGDEFIVLLEQVEDPEDAVRVAERVTNECRAPFVFDGRELFVSISMGVAVGSSRTKSAEDLLRDADTAMYRAKEAGASYMVFDSQMYLRAIERLELENDLRRAIQAEEFVVHYQPIMDLSSGGLQRVEALVRWDHPERGLLNPDEFVPAAEESGLVIPMGEWVLEEACRQGKVWQEEHPRIPPLIMNVNLSARQLRRPDLASTVRETLRRTGFDAVCLSLDITETVYIKALEGNTSALDELKRLGVNISIDDFGVGYSSLAYLKRLPAEILKIDKSFVRDLGADVEDTAIVGMVIELAHTLGMEVVAEGVESQEQAKLLREMGCDMAQGYYFSEPLPPEAAAEYLAEQQN